MKKLEDNSIRVEGKLKDNSKSLTDQIEENSRKVVEKSVEYSAILEEQLKKKRRSKTNSKNWKSGE